MSASNEKKRRQLERELGIDKREADQLEEEKKARKSERNWRIGTASVILLVAVILLLNSGLLYRLPALTVGNTTYSVAEMQYYYAGMYTNLYSYGLLDAGKPLNEQECSYLEEEGATWWDYIEQNVRTSIESTEELYQLAVKEGFTLSEEGKASVDREIQSMQETADENSMSIKALVRRYYGEGVTVGVVRRLMEKSKLVEEYEQAVKDRLTATDEEIKAYYEEHIEEYKTYDYLFYAVPAETEEALDENGDPVLNDDGDPVVNVVEGSLENANRIIEAMATVSNDEESFQKAVNAYIEGDAPQVISGATADRLMTDWIAEEDREYGDVAVCTGEDAGYVIMYIGSDDQMYPEVSVRHILIRTVDEDEDGAYSEEELEAAKTRVEELRAEWEAGEKTEESFAALANEKSEDEGSNTNGGLYEGIAKGQMVEEFNDFCFAEDRKPGDVDIVHGNNGGYDGYHLIYFVGQGENHGYVQAKSKLQSEAYEKWHTETVTEVTAVPLWGLRFVRIGV